MSYTVLYNPHAGAGCGTQEARRLETLLPGESLRFADMTEVKSYRDFFAKLDKGEDVIVCGGDGTLNRFVNDCEGLDFPCDILYFATGSGNDFLHDLGLEKGAMPFSVKKYLRDLPQVTVNGRTCRFLNGIGYGIDGYCCEEGDRLRAKSDKPVNYTAIAIKGLLFHYKPANAVVTVDGERYAFKKVWLAPTMNGRFYGGGMMVAPAQERLSSARSVSVSMLFGSGKLKTLLVFPTIFKGTHVRHTEMSRVLAGHEIHVEFDRPTALQIDGETVLNVKEYSVSSKIPARV